MDINPTQSISDNDNDLESVSHQVSSDLKQKLNTFHNPKKGIKVLSRLIGVHEKTLIRLINQENKPGAQTLLKIYRYLLAVTNDHDLVNQVPCCIAQLLKSKISHISSSKIMQSSSQSLNIETELCDNPIFIQIYFYLVTGGITKEKIIFKFGQYGNSLLNDMLINNIAICLQSSGLNILGPNQLTLSPSTIKKMGISFLKLTSNHSKEDIGIHLGSHFQTLHIEGLNATAYNQWLKIDEECYQKKMEIIENENSRGKIRTITYSLTDTIQ